MRMSGSEYGGTNTSEWKIEYRGKAGETVTCLDKKLLRSAARVCKSLMAHGVGSTA